MRIAALATGAVMLLAAQVVKADDQKLQSCYRVLGPTVECPVNLVRGKDYALRRHGDYGSGCVEMLTPQRTSFGKICGSYDRSWAYEFRSGTTGQFWIRVSSEEKPTDEGPAGSIFSDCRNANNTQCLLTLTNTGTGGHAGINDFDRWKSPQLRAGRTYTLTVSANLYMEVAILTAGGTKLVGGHVNSDSTKEFRFKAPSTSPVYVRTNQGSPYTLKFR